MKIIGSIEFRNGFLNVFCIVRLNLNQYVFDYPTLRVQRLFANTPVSLRLSHGVNEILNK